MSVRLTLVGAHHPPSHFSEMRRIDVVLDVPLRALHSPSFVRGRIAVEALARETPCRGTIARSGLSLSLALAFTADDATETTLVVRSGSGVPPRSLTELRGELCSGGDTASVRAVVLRLDVLAGAARFRDDPT